MKRKNAIIFFTLLGMITLLPTISTAKVSFLETLQEEFRISAEQQVIRQWTRPHTIIFTSTGRTFKHATKISPDGMTCSFFCEGKHYFISGTYIIEEE